MNVESRKYSLPTNLQNICCKNNTAIHLKFGHQL